MSRELGTSRHGEGEGGRWVASVEEEHRRALRHLAVIMVALMVMGGLTYVVPPLARFRPWVPGEPIPFAGMLRWDRVISGDAGIAAPSSAPTSGAQATKALAESLGDAVAAAADESEEEAELARLSEARLSEKGAGGAAGQPPGSGNQPITSTHEHAGTAARELQQAGEGRAPGAEMEQPPTRARPASLDVSEDDLKGLAREIEDPTGSALDPFWAQLVLVAQGSSPTRAIIAHYGDSTIALDGITSTLRRRLQQRFGDAGHGFVLGGKGYLPYGHKDMKFSENGGWDLATITKGGRKDGRYGYGGTLFRSSGGARSTFGTVAEGPIGTEVTAFDVYYAAHTRGGKLELTLDGAEPILVDTRLAEDTGVDVVDRFERVEAPRGTHSLQVRAAGGGEVRLYGVSLERGERGIIYDSLGIVGARASRLLNADAQHLREQFEHRKPTLLVLQFGGNEAVDRQMKMDWYDAKLTEVVKHMRAATPESACLLMGPLDQGERDDRGRVRTIPIVPKMVEVQRKVAFEQGCAYWSTFDAMGGEGSMARWYDAKPRLGWGDYIHATPKGYEVLGNMAYKALLKGLATYLASP